MIAYGGAARMRSRRSVCSPEAAMSAWNGTGGTPRLDVGAGSAGTSCTCPSVNAITPASCPAGMSLLARARAANSRVPPPPPLPAAACGTTTVRSVRPGSRFASCSSREAAASTTAARPPTAIEPVWSSTSSAVSGNACQVARTRCGPASQPSTTAKPSSRQVVPPARNANPAPSTSRQTAPSPSSSGIGSSGARVIEETCDRLPVMPSETVAAGWKADDWFIRRAAAAAPGRAPGPPCSSR